MVFRSGFRQSELTEEQHSSTVIQWLYRRKGEGCAVIPHRAAKKKKEAGFVL